MIAGPETSVTNNLRYVTFQNSEDVIYAAAEAWSHTFHTILWYFSPLPCVPHAQPIDAVEQTWELQ
jgi:hypothetical protein